MYTLMYVDPETIPVEDYFTAIKTYVDSCKKYQLQDHYQNIGLDLVTYVHKNYELDLIFFISV